MALLPAQAGKADMPPSITLTSHFLSLGHYSAFAVHRGQVARAFECWRDAWVLEAITKLHSFRWEKGPKEDSTIISGWSFPGLYIYQQTHWEVGLPTFQMAQRTTGGNSRKKNKAPSKQGLPKEKSKVIVLLNCSFIGQGLHFILRVRKCFFWEKWH